MGSGLFRRAYDPGIQEQTSDDGAGNGPQGHGDEERLILPQHGKAFVPAEPANATSIVGSDTARDRLPALLISA
jgi:hypothetical protein